MPQPGVINGQSGYFGDAVVDRTTYDALGFYDVYYGFEAIRAEATPTALKARAKVQTSAQPKKDTIRKQF